MKKIIILLLFALPFVAGAQTKVFRIPSGGGTGSGMTAAERATLESIKSELPKLVKADSGYGLISDAEKALIQQLEQRPIFNRDSVYTKAAKVPSEDITGGTIFTGVVNRSIPAPTASNLHLMYTPVDILVSGVRDALVGTSPSVTYSIRYGSLRNTTVGTIVNARTTTSTVGAAATLTGTTVAIPAGSWIWLEITSVSGTISDFGLTLIYN